MDLYSIRIITNDVSRLVDFYQQLGLAAEWRTDEFAELSTPSCTLAIGSQRTMDRFGAGAARAGENRTLILEFRVSDVDREYARLAGVVSDIVQEPVTQPWGNRSLLLRDPDGNLINLFTPVSAEAIARYPAGARPRS
jgi:uncharacterized glyoxalase superfamily protein PhnB